MNRLIPLQIHWLMKPLSSGKTEINDLSDGRLELKIKHEVIKGVTPEMLVWWFHNFTEMNDYDYKGQKISIYRLWHPIDHISVRVSKQSTEGTGFIKGAEVEICEALGKNGQKIKGKVKQMDQTGVTLHLNKGPITIGRLRHNFTNTPDGTLYESRLLLGPTTPIIGKMITKIIRKKVFTLDRCNSWLKHNIEEVGNFQFFLPELFEKEK